MSDTPAPVAPEGWYPDPFGRFDSRRWDGSTWTDEVRMSGGPGLDPSGAASAQAESQTAGRRASSAKFWVIGGVVAVGVIVAFVIALVLVMGQDHAKSSVASVVTTAPPTTTTTSSTAGVSETGYLIAVKAVGANLGISDAQWLTWGHTFCDDARSRGFPAVSAEYLLGTSGGPPSGTASGAVMAGAGSFLCPEFAGDVSAIGR